MYTRVNSTDKVRSGLMAVTTDALVMMPTVDSSDAQEGMYTLRPV